MFKSKTKVQEVYNFMAYTECKLSTNVLEKCEEVVSMEYQSPLYSKIMLRLLGADEIG